MTKADYGPLIEKIRIQMSSWTATHLSYAGRMQSLHSVISSITNFWISAFRLPNGCIKEINKLWAAFLWFGPELNTRKAQVAWRDVCKPKEEGSLGFKDIKEANVVCCLKLIWRIVSDQESLWVKWIRTLLIGKDWFWSTKENTTKGSWMWRKLLKYRALAKDFHRVETHNGQTTSFWFNHWTPLGRLWDVTGSRGPIDMGIPRLVTVSDILGRRPRQHRVPSLNHIKEAIDKAKATSNTEADRVL